MIKAVSFIIALFKKQLKNNNVEIYSTFNERKSVVSERLIRTLKNKFYKHMTPVSKNTYFDVLDDIVDEHKTHSIDLLK